MTDRPVVFIVSDSVGETADLVTRAAISQFQGNAIDVRRFPLVPDVRAIADIVEAARQQPALIVFTLIVPGVRDELITLTKQYGIPAIDIMGPMLGGLQQLLGREPRLEPGLIHKLDEDYFRRIEAVEFAVKYDDGKDPKGFLRADVVLLGISRTSKTPVSMYLAHRRVKVANLPLVPEVTVPKEIFLVDPRKVVGLRIGPEKLHHIRVERVKTIGLRSDANYSNLERILVELEYAESVFKKIGCPVVDVTNKAIEETAVRVLESINSGGKFGD